jgi:RhoGEF domain/FYVE zinc finger/SOS1/NGEF-like PH domain
MIVEQYLNPLREANLVTKKTLGQIFANIEDIRVINKELLEALEARMATWDNDTRVGDVFQKLVPFLKLYKVYCANYNGGLTRLEQKRESNSALAKFLEKSREEIGLNMPLPSLLIQPVQRLPRYRLLFAELLNLTDEAHVDYGAIKASLESVEEIAMLVNESIREAEYLNKVLEIKKKFSGAGVPDLVVPKRFLVREGQLAKVCRKEVKPRYFFLFNDILIYAGINDAATTAVGAGGLYRFHRAMPLRYTQVSDVPTRAGGRQHAFQVLSKEKSFSVYARDDDEKGEWLRDLQKTIGDAVSGASSSDAAAKFISSAPAAASRADTADAATSSAPDTAAAAAPAPVWIPDKDRKTCMICDMKFTTLKRRHHCRRCGTLCCGTCSSHKAFLPNIGKTCRVCFTCYEVTTGRPSKKDKPGKGGASSGAAGSGGAASSPKAKAPPLPGQPVPPLDSDDEDYTSGSDFYDTDDDEWLPPSTAPPLPPI